VIEAIFTLVGLVVGGAVVFGVMMRRRGVLVGEVSGLSATLAEVRSQLETRETELAAARQALESEKIITADSKARMEAGKERFAEQRKQFEEMDKKLKDSFEALSAAALRSNNEQFVTLADAKMKPLREQLERYEKYIKDLEKTRAEAYGGLTKHLSTLEQRSERLGTETSQLVAALRQSGAKGKWGELTLQRVVELTGMTEHCDFDLQVSVEGSDGRQRPDLVVRMPGERSLVVDAKVNTGAYLDAVNATTEEDRQRHLAKYAKDVRSTLVELGRREYWKAFSPAPEFVVMFMPGEAFFAAAVSQDNDLIADGVEKGVIAASPTTLIALLLAVRHGWQQHKMAENAQKIADAGRDLYDRLCTFVEHLDDVRGGIEKAAEAYNRAVGNWQHRTEPGARKLKELGAADVGKELPKLLRADVKMREA